MAHMSLLFFDPIGPLQSSFDLPLKSRSVRTAQACIQKKEPPRGCALVMLHDGSWVDRPGTIGRIAITRHYNLLAQATLQWRPKVIWQIMLGSV